MTPPCEGEHADTEGESLSLNAAPKRGEEVPSKASRGPFS